MTNLGSPIRIVQTDFRSGEVDPLLAMRVDSKIYPSGARSLENCLLRAGGSVSRRPGTTRLATLTSKRRLISFEFDADEKYIFAFGAAALGIYDGSGTLVASFSGSTNCPWSSDTIVSQMTFAQAGDTMVICHESFKPKVLTRTSLTTFSMADFVFQQASNGVKIRQPYYKFEASSVTLAISSSAPGSGRTVTASSAIFSSAWIGDTIRIFGNECTVTGYTSTTQITVTVKSRIKAKLDPYPIRYKVNDANLIFTHANHGMSGTATVSITGAITEFGIGESQIRGAGRSVTVIDEDTYSFTASSSPTSAGDGGGTTVEVETNAATRSWDEQVFSARRGWPSACCFHEDRLWFGGSTSLPDGIFASKTGLYYNFDVEEGEDDASIQVTVGSPRIAAVQHILAGPVLQIFTEGAEFVARQSDGAGLTPSNITIRPQTPFGCSTVRPRIFDGATIFVQANNKTVREFSYSDTSNGFQATDLTTLSQHLVSSVVSMDVLYGSTSRTEQYAFVVNSDGTMAVFHSNRQEGLAGWVPWSTSGTFESVCVLGTSVYVAVLRSGTRYLEKIEMDSTSILLDWSISQTNGTAKTSWSLGSAYASKTLHVTSNGYYLGTVTANGSGTITTPYAVTSINAGLNYDWEVVPLPPDTDLPDGMMTGEKRRISSVTIHAYNTLSLNVDGKAVIAATIGTDLSVAPTPISRKLRRYLFGYDRDPVVTLTQPAPLPVTILGMSMELSL